MIGSDGKNYEYLLKAREDLRQDERVMQLLHLTNSLIRSDRRLEARHCTIPVRHSLYGSCVMMCVR